LFEFVAKSLIARYNRALQNVTESRRAFEQLDDAAPAEKAVWLTEIEEAEAKRSSQPSAMDVMHSKIKTGATLKDVMAEIRRRDSEKGAVKDDGTATDWLLEGLLIEDEQ